MKKEIQKILELRFLMLEALHTYSIENRGEDDLRGIIKSFAEIIEMSYDDLIEELKWIKEYEND